MSDLTYHLREENRSCKNYLIVDLVSGSKKLLTKDILLSLAVTTSEKSGLEFLIKEQARQQSSSFTSIPVHVDRSFELLKWLGTTGRVFYKEKKVVIDPFTLLDIYFEVDRQDPETALVKGCWRWREQSGALHECEWVVAASPSWVLKEGIIRPIKEEISSHWVKLALLGPQTLKGPELSQFLTRAADEVPIVWKSGNGLQIADPIPFLLLTCRHGGFADLWFDYGAYGKRAAHDSTAESWRNSEGERNWEKDLLETGFVKKIVDRSHYYCSLDKVAKSLTFLLEIGWTVVDARGRKVLRQKKGEFDAEFSENSIAVRAKIHYDDHRVDLKDLVGAFNRQEHFVELSPHAVALIDRENFETTWGDFTEQEITSEGIVLK